MWIYPIWFIAFVGGIIYGTHMPWHYEVIAIGVGWLFTTHGPYQEMEAIFPMFATIFFAIGCGIGDISWAIQTDNIPGIGELINSIGNPFEVN